MLAVQAGAPLVPLGQVLEFLVQASTFPRSVIHCVRMVEDLLAAASKGAYFNRHIRDGFPYQRVS